MTFFVVIAAAPELRRQFTSDEQVREFSARMISESRNAMRHAYAMKRLIGQFSPEELRSLSPEERKELGSAQGVVVEQVGGAAARAGIRRGDVITAVNGTPVKSPDDLRRQLEKAKGSVALLVRRGDASIFVPLDIG